LIHGNQSVTPAIARATNENVTMQIEIGDAAIYQRPAELLRALLRFDTTNPPGNESDCIAYIASLVRAAGVEPLIVARDLARPNLVARLRGRGSTPPLLLYGHVDVVTTSDQAWTHPPFAADEADGFIWGRGALDMKGGVAMLLAAFLRAAVEGTDLPGDVVLALVSDEEADGNYGARFLVAEHAELFAGVRYALGELGGFTAYVSGRAFYPIMVAEKQSCQLRATLRGPGGHGSLPLRGGAMAQLGRFLTTLDRRRLPVHISDATHRMVEATAAALPFPDGLVLRQLLTPALTDRVLDLLGPRGAAFDPLLHDTVNATIVRGGEKNNVIPSRVTVDLDGRLLPGRTDADLLRDLGMLAGPAVELEVLSYEPYPMATPNIGLFATLADILRTADPGATPIPYLLSGVTDGRHFARLGIQTYGFLPMKLPRDWSFAELIHNADERIPTEALAFGADAIHTALRRFGEAS
jgi:acetylornithine deacetylase/succinyl-diaminopimelate desuccinylase-like protein